MICRLFNCKRRFGILLAGGVYRRCCYNFIENAKVKRFGETNKILQ